jgi:HEPN domain-containing protein/predicted nucleotidyltransferase
VERSGDWLRQAERDLEKARLDHEHGYFDWACFTAHQAAEKALKALVQSQNRSVRGHSLLHLLQGTADVAAPPEELLHGARVLDRYCIEARYPNGFPVGAPLDSSTGSSLKRRSMLQTRSFGTVEVTSVDRDALLAELGRSAERLTREAPEVVEVQVFGSFARGDHTPESDVDVLIVVSRGELPFLERPDAYRDAFEGIPLDVNLTVYTVEEAAGLRRDPSSFLARIAPEARPLFLRDR